MIRRANPLTDDPARLSKLLQTLFQKRRKQLGSILGRETALPAGSTPCQAGITFRGTVLQILAALFGLIGGGGVAYL